MPLKSGSFETNDPHSISSAQFLNQLSAAVSSARNMVCQINRAQVEDTAGTWDSGRAKSEARSAEARQLAEAYAKFMGFDVNKPDGRAMSEKTARFYSQSDALLDRLRGLVRQFCAC